MQTSHLLGELALLQSDAEKAADNIQRLMERLDAATKWVSKRQHEAERSGNLVEYRQRVAEEAALNAAYQRLSQSRGKMIYGGAITGSEVKQTDA